MRRQRRLYFSYAPDDVELARTLANAVRSTVEVIWPATEDLAPGTRLVDAVRDGITRADAFVMVATEAALKSTWTQVELGAATAAGVPVIEVVATETGESGLRGVPRVASIRLDDEAPERLLAAIEKLPPVGVPRSPARSARVFVSYSRADDLSREGGMIGFMRDVVAAANTNHGVPIELFVDVGGVPVGEEYPERLLHEIKRCDVFVAFVSDKFSASHWCPKELAWFRQGQAERLSADGLLWVSLESDAPAIAQDLLLATKQQWVAWADVVADRAVSVAKAAKDLRDMVRRLEPRGARRPGPRDPTPEPEQYQFLSAFDSVRTQRGAGENQEGLVRLRAQLSYLLGYTVVIPDSQALDSLGAIRTIVEAAQAWREAEGHPIVPYRLSWFGVRHPHLVDRAIMQLGNKNFETSAWHPHERPRTTTGGGRGSLEQAQGYKADWEAFVDVARFLSWYQTPAVGKSTTRTMIQRLRDCYFAAEQERPDAVTPELLGAMRRVIDAGDNQRSSLYFKIDGWTDIEAHLVEALKDVVDIAYNRTVAGTVLDAATSERRRKSIVLTDPTPETQHAGVLALTKYILEQDAALEGAQATLHGAWDSRDAAVRHGTRALSRSELSWDRVLEIAVEPGWHRRRNTLIRAREPAARSDAMGALARWVADQLKDNMILGSTRDAWNVEITTTVDVVGLGDPEGRVVSGYQED